MKRIDTDNDKSISLEELETAAKNEELFDPINRAALKFLARNYDKLGKLDPQDGTADFGGWDMSALSITTTEMSRIPARQRALRQLSNWFTQIDANGNGVITERETYKWIDSRDHLIYRIDGVSDVIPRQTIRKLPKAEQFSKDDLQKKWKELDDEYKAYIKSWK